MKSEKLLIHEDLATAEREVNKLESQIPILNKLVGLFDELDLGKLDEKTALSLLIDKGTTAGEMFLNVIAADCLATGNRNKHFINQQIKAQEQTVLDFKNDVKTVLNETERGIDYSKFSYSESVGFFISVQSKEAIAEENKLYLVDKKDIEYYEAVKEVCKTINVLNRITIERTGYNHTTPSNFNSGFYISRLDKEINLLKEVISASSETTEPDPKKIFSILRKSNIHL